jgi:hypothetical protein
MKRITFLFSLLLFATFISYAQTNKGKILVGGSANLASVGGGSGNSRETAINFSPQIGFFAVDNLALGINLPISYQSSTNSSSTDYAIAPFLRYYFLNGKVKPFLHGEGGFAGGNVYYKDFSGRETSVSPTGYALGVQGGVAVFLTESVGLDIALGYATTTLSSNGVDYSRNAFGLRLGFLAYLGK